MVYVAYVLVILGLVAGAVVLILRGHPVFGFLCLLMAACTHVTTKEGSIK